MSEGAQIDATRLIRVKAARSRPGTPGSDHIVDRLIFLFGYRPGYPTFASNHALGVQVGGHAIDNAPQVIKAMDAPCA